MKDPILYYWQTVVKPAKEAEAKKKPPPVTIEAFKNGAPVMYVSQEKPPAG